MVFWEKVSKLENEKLSKKAVLNVRVFVKEGLLTKIKVGEREPSWKESVFNNKTIIKSGKNKYFIKNI